MDNQSSQQSTKPNLVKSIKHLLETKKGRFIGLAIAVIVVVLFVLLLNALMGPSKADYQEAATATEELADDSTSVARWLDLYTGGGSGLRLTSPKDSYYVRFTKALDKYDDTVKATANLRAVRGDEDVQAAFVKFETVYKKYVAQVKGVAEASPLYIEVYNKCSPINFDEPTSGWAYDMPKSKIYANLEDYRDSVKPCRQVVKDLEAIANKFAADKAKVYSKALVAIDGVYERMAAATAAGDRDKMEQLYDERSQAIDDLREVDNSLSAGFDDELDKVNEGPAIEELTLVINKKLNQL